MTGPAVEPEVEALAVLEEAVALLVNLLGWGVVLGLAYTWNATFHHIFQGIADALSFTINTHLGYSHTFHLGGWASDLDHKVQEWFTSWAAEQEKQVGMWWYAIGWTVNEIVVSVEDMAAASVRAFKWVANTFVPTYVQGAQDLWKQKSNKAAAVAGAAGALIAILHKTQRAEHQAEQAAAQAERAATRAVEAEAHHAKKVATGAAAAAATGAAVITQVIDVPSLPVPFGRTVKQIWRRLGRVEALFGASAMAIAMANVLGIPSWRCLTRGPLGRLSRFFCGLDKWLIDALLLGIVESFVATDLCDFTDLMIKQAELLRPALMELVDVEDALIGCHGATKPPNLALPRLSLPPMPAASALAA